MNDKEKILIIKLDAIGDFILFDRCFKSFLRSKYGIGKNFFLLGNSKWKSISDFKDYYRVYWLDTNKFQNNRIYRRLFLWKVSFLKFQKVLVPTFSRRFFIEDDIVRRITSSEKIAPLDDGSNQTKTQIAKSNTYYTAQIDCGPRTNFELQRYLTFFNRLSNSNLKLIQSKKQKKANEIEQIIIAPFAGEPEREWALDHIYKLIKLLLAFDGRLAFIIVGTIERRKEVSEKFGDLKSVKNLCGSLTLAQLFDEIRKSDLVVTMESALAHICASIGVTFCCISNGNHFLRFHPYPEEYTNSKNLYCYPFEVEMLDPRQAVKFNAGSDLDINLISPQNVYDEIMTNSLLQ